MQWEAARARLHLTGVGALTQLLSFCVSCGTPATAQGLLPAEPDKGVLFGNGLLEWVNQGGNMSYTKVFPTS